MSLTHPASIGPPIRIVLADDHTVFRQGFRLLLKDQTDIELVGEAANGNELLAAVERLRPDVVITDIKMPEMDGVEATRQIKERHPGTGIIALSQYADKHLLTDMFTYGARGYLLKNTTAAEVFTAVKTVAQNGTYCCPTVTDTLAHLVTHEPENTKPETAKPSFSQKERDVMRLTCEECCSKQIAAELHTTKRAVEGIRERVRIKTGAKTMVGVALYAIRNGLFKP